MFYASVNNMASIKKNYLYQVMYEILAILIPLITAPYITRVLGANQLGVFSYTQSVASLFLSVARLGVVNHGSRSIAAVQNDKEKRSMVFVSIFCVQFFFSLFVTVIYVIYVLLFLQEYRIIAMLQTLWVATAMVDISWAFMGMENFKVTVLRGISIKVISLVMIFIFVRNPAELWIYTLIVAGSAISGNLVLWMSKKKYFRRVIPDKKDIFAQIKPMFILFIPTIAVTIYTMMDKIMLGRISGTIYVSYYEYSSKLVSIPMGFITSFGAVMIPRMSALANAGISENQKNDTICKSLVFVMFLGVAFSFGLASISDVLIPIYYGAAFFPCVILLKIVAIKLPAMAWANVIRTQVLIPEHKDKEYIISLFIGAAVNLLLNLYFISKYQAVGAAIATVIAEIAVCMVQSMFFSNKKVLVKPILYSIGYLLIGVGMYAVVQNVGKYLMSPLWNLAIEVIVGSIFYLILGGLFTLFIVLKIKPKQLINRMMKKNYSSEEDFE